MQRICSLLELEVHVGILDCATVKCISSPFYLVIDSICLFEAAPYLVMSRRCFIPRSVFTHPSICIMTDIQANVGPRALARVFSPARVNERDTFITSMIEIEC